MPSILNSKERLDILKKEIDEYNEKYENAKE
jgi:hypothetical protein